MRKEAESHAEEDKNKKDNAEIKNQTDAVVFQTEKLLKESGDKMKPEDKKELEEKLEALKKVKDTDQYDEMKKKMEELSQVAQKIGAAMYSASAEASADKQSREKKDDKNNQPADEKGPVEGEFEEGKNNNKK